MYANHFPGITPPDLVTCGLQLCLIYSEETFHQKSKADNESAFL
jgi:hypothetical protein